MLLLPLRHQQRHLYLAVPLLMLLLLLLLLVLVLVLPCSVGGARKQTQVLLSAQRLPLLVDCLVEEQLPHRPKQSHRHLANLIQHH